MLGAERVSFFSISRLTHTHIHRHHLLLVSLLLLNAAAAEALPLFLGASLCPIRPSLAYHHHLDRATYPIHKTQNPSLPPTTIDRTDDATDALVPSWCAILVSVTLVLVLGEILPTTIFSGAL